MASELQDQELHIRCLMPKFRYLNRLSRSFLPLPPLNQISLISVLYLPEILVIICMVAMLSNISTAINLGRQKSVLLEQMNTENCSLKVTWMACVLIFQSVLHWHIKLINQHVLDGDLKYALYKKGWCWNKRGYLPHRHKSGGTVSVSSVPCLLTLHHKISSLNISVSI